MLLTWNEEANIGRTLESLAWAGRVVIVDSGSTDRTEAIAKSFPNVDWRFRRFDNHLDQWRHAILESGIQSEFVLALDADMATPPAFLDEVEHVFLPRGFSGGRVGFSYCVSGIRLRGSLCPSQLRLFRPSEVQICQRGHTQQFSVPGPIYRFRAPILHDDRKPLERWVQSQLSYSLLEQERLAGTPYKTWKDRLREAGWMAPVAGIAAYLRAGGPFGGAAAAHYAFERVTYECLLALRLLRRKIDDAAEQR